MEGAAPTCDVLMGERAEGAAPTCDVLGAAPTCDILGEAQTCDILGAAPTCDVLAYDDGGTAQWVGYSLYLSIQVCTTTTLLRGYFHVPNNPLFSSASRKTAELF